ATSRSGTPASRTTTWATRTARRCGTTTRGTTSPAPPTCSSSAAGRLLGDGDGDRHRGAAALEVELELPRIAQRGVDLERLVGRAERAAVDRLERVAVRDAEPGEDRARADRVDLEAGRMPVLHRGHDPRALRDRHRVQQHLVEEVALELVVRVVDLADPGV